MKLKKEFIVYDTGGGALLVPTANAGFSGVVQGNITLSAILELLKTDTDEETLVAALRRRFRAPEGAVERDVKQALEDLRSIGALTE